MIPAKNRTIISELIKNELYTVKPEGHLNTPELPESEKIRLISRHFEQIMTVLGLDLTDDSLKDTPQRVAKMFVRETFAGLNPANKPEITLFENKYKYDQMVMEKNISLFSTCEHHFVPIIGKAHIAYISTGKIIGLSKLNRIVNYFSKRPQVQERLTMEIAEELKRALQTDHVAVLIEADHLCVQSRGIRDTSSSTITAQYHGRFKDEGMKKEFLTCLHPMK